MPKDILLYGSIYSDTAEKFFETVNKAVDDNGGEMPEFNFRINTTGGEPRYMQGILKKIQELGQQKGIVDGMAYSAGAFACCLLAEVDGVDGSQYLIHRGSTWTEKYPDLFNEAEKKMLTECNKFLRKILEAKVDVEKFEKVAKHTMDEIFSLETRLDIILTAREAKEVGLINEVVRMTPTRKKSIAAYVESVDDHKFQLAAKKILKEEEEEEEEETPEPKKTLKSNNMTIEKLKAEFPAVYAAILALGHADGVKAGVTAERDRVGEWMAYMDIDAKVVTEGITKGEELSRKVAAEFSVKAMSPEYLKKLASDSAKDVTTATKKDLTIESAKEAEVKEFEKGLDAKLGKKVA